MARQCSSVGMLTAHMTSEAAVAAIQVTKVMNILRQLSPAMSDGREQQPVYSGYRCKNRSGKAVGPDAPTVWAMGDCNVQQLAVSYLAVLFGCDCLQWRTCAK